MASPQQGLIIDCFNITVIVIVCFNGCQLLMLKGSIFELEADILTTLCKATEIYLLISLKDPLGVRHDELSSKSFSNTNTNK